MNIVIVGAGKVGLALTRQLSGEHRLTLIDQDAKLIEKIINIYDVMAVCGNGASYEIQQEAEVSRADLLIATASSDEIMYGRQKIRRPAYDCENTQSRI